MRKTLISILIVLLLLVICFMVFNKIDIGNVHILGVKKLNEENKKLDTSIQALTKLSSTEYEQTLSSIKESAKQYSQTKNEYDEIASVSSDADLGVANQLQKYEIEYLWTRIGGHASSENVVLRLEVKANSTSSATGYYDLSFAALGDYVGITDFIYDIENDSSLGFKIENFKLEPAGSTLQATFTCTNIAINIDPSELSGGKNTEEEKTDKEENTNTTNTTDSKENNSNTTSNTTNTTSVNTTN